MSQAMSTGGGGGGGGAGQFGDTTFTKVFVGGLAWETHKEGMRAYFEQFGDILEAVVITDKNSGRSKGYGFVTFREPDAAMRACIDPYPGIDGRRANCNLAYLGVNKSKTAPVPPYLQPYAAYVHGGGNMRAVKSIHTAAGVGTGGASLSFVPTDHGIQQGIPATYNVYAGYSPYYSADYGYPLSYYQQAAAYGGLQGAQQYAVFGGGATAAAAGLTMAANPAGPYPYFQFAPASAAAAAAAGYSMAPYPQSLYHYAAAAAAGATTTATATTLQAGGLQQYIGAVAFTPNSTGQAGMTMSMTAPALPAPTAQYQYSKLAVPSQLAAAPDQKPSLA